MEVIIPQNGMDQVANIKIKIEVDQEPPLGFETEDKFLLKPFSFDVKCLTLPNLFAVKQHALLFANGVKMLKGEN